MIEHLQELWDLCFKRIPEMEEALKTAPSLYESLATTSAAAISKWEWTALPRYELEPFYFELGDCRRGRPMKKEPEKTAGRHQYGFSDSGELVTERQHVEFPGQYYETFFQYRDEEVLSCHYSYAKDKAPINCTRMFVEDEDVMCFQSWGTMGCAQHVYVLARGRIAWRLTSHRPFRRKPFGGVSAMEYLDNGEVRIFAGGELGKSNLVYHGQVVANNSVEKTANKLRLLVPSLRSVA